MDTTAQIKQNLISRIENSQDLHFLSALQDLFDSSELALYQLTTVQEADVENGRNNIRNGDFQKSDDLISEMKRWLEKK